MRKFFAFFLCFLCFCYAKSMVVLDPASIEILYMIGAEDEILAIPSMKNIEPVSRTTKLETVGTYTRPNIEKILSLKPKIVILTSYSIDLKDNLESRGIKTMVLPVSNLTDIYDNIITLGRLTNREEKAQIVAKDFMQKLEAIKANQIKKSGIFIYSATPLMAFGKDTLPGSVLEAIGISNIAANSIGKQPIINPEFLAAKNPDIILYGLQIKSKDELLRANSAFKYLKAIQNNNVYFLELHALLRGSPSIINQIMQIKNDLEKSMQIKN